MSTRRTYENLGRVSEWYSTLRPLLLDLVGDYAGQELFFIEGDSLCRHIFNDSRIAIHDGPQVAHGIYVLEQFLSNLQQRGCNFHIVFFEAHKYQSFDQSQVDVDRAWRYLLVRDAFVKHLEESLSPDNPVKVRHFITLNDRNFDTYLDESKPYFCMAHDVPGLVTPHREQHFLQSGILWKMLLKGYNVALLDKVEFRDSKIMTLVVEGHSFGKFTPYFIQQCTEEMASATYYLNETYDLDDEYTDTNISPATLSLLTHPRELIIIGTMSAIFNADGETGVELLKSFGSTLLQMTALLQVLSLEERCLPDVELRGNNAQKVDAFVNLMCRYLSMFIGEKETIEALQKTYPDVSVEFCDLIDVRLFRYCLANAEFAGTHEVTSDTERLMEAYKLQTGSELDSPNLLESATIEAPKKSKEPLKVSVLPFQHKAFDEHLAIIKLNIDSSEYKTPEILHRVAREQTHWHNTGALKGEMRKLTKWQARSDQKFEAHMQRYAASITGQTAGTLEPELIVVDRAEEKPKKGIEQKRPAKEDVGQASPGPKKGGHPNKGKKAPVKKADLIRAANTKVKAEKTEEKVTGSWSRVLDEAFELLDKARGISGSEDAALTTLGRLAEFQRIKLKSDTSTYVFLETRLFRLSLLLDLWRQACRQSAKEKKRRQNLAALILDEARHMLASPALTKKIRDIVAGIWVDMGFGNSAPVSQAQGKDSLSPRLDIPRVSADMKIDRSSIEFQLTYSGPYMDRSFGSAPDSRVKFHPDTWQRDVLDQIDADKSVFVVAPTSAGKTFISFYAMEKVLRGSNDGVLVYVAPTKALVNQIAAEIHARFAKKYPHTGTVWAIHTRDYRIHHPEQCQILVTVPHILQIMLLSPHNAGKWAPRVKRIIFDEIHSIGQAEDGVIWEQLLLIAPCPIIALSATVGNPGEFRDWLVETQKAADIDLTMIEHQHRYSDLRKFIYLAPKDEVFTGLDRKRHFEELDDDPNFAAVNPISTLTDVKHRALPSDLSLEPRDCLELYQIMIKHQRAGFEVDKELQPATFFRNNQAVIGKVDVIRWESSLKQKLGEWMADSSSPFEAVMEDLLKSRNEKTRALKGNNTSLGSIEGLLANTKISSASSSTESSSSSSPSRESDFDDALDNYEMVQDTMLSLLTRLHRKNALPAILFSYDRAMVERIATTILRQLEEAEAHFKTHDPEYLRQLQSYQEHLKQAKSKTKAKSEEKDKKKKKGKNKNRDDDIDALKHEQHQETYDDASKWESFDPDAPHENFLFTGKVNHDTEEDFDRLKNVGIPDVFVAALRRGIGIHHAGLSRHLREVTETLFRMGYLRVVIATGTLALGINMPCKTVVFAGDSVYLTALAYRQCSGRAGRRGFDLFGNVIFHRLSENKINRLIGSRLPSLKGHFPISTSLVLRMLSLVEGSQNSSYSKKAVNQLLSQPRLFMGSDSFKEQVLHHLRFSIEYLRRQHLIDAKGKPINFAGLVGHLYYTQNSAFAFHALLKSGVMHTICKDFDKKPQRTCLLLMSVLAHIFGRRLCKDPARLGPKMLEIIKLSPSDVYLAPLPKIARQALTKHNEETLNTFHGYAASFAQQYCQNIADNKLPFTKKDVGSHTDKKLNSQFHTRSVFFRNSGQTDKFTSGEDLATSARSGVFLESGAIPIMDVEHGYYNAYLLDFYKHGSTHPLTTANGLRKNDVWFMLNDFSMILATIVTSMKNFFSEKEVAGGDNDYLDLLAMEEGEQIDAEEDDIETRDGDEDEGEIDMSRINHAALDDPRGMLRVFKAFVLLKSRFDEKLLAIGATKRFQAKGKRRPKLRL